MVTNKITVQELSERIDSLEKSVNEVDDKTNQLSKNIITNTRFNIELKEIRKTFSDIDRAINDKRIDIKTFFISVIFITVLSFAFGFVVGEWHCINSGGEIKTTETITETIKVVKPKDNK
jgi:hypothetical protein